MRAPLDVSAFLFLTGIGLIKQHKVYGFRCQCSGVSVLAAGFSLLAAGQ